jgi:hypothetical protein
MDMSDAKMKESLITKKVEVLATQVYYNWVEAEPNPSLLEWFRRKIRFHGIIIDVCESNDFVFIPRAQRMYTEQYGWCIY